MKKSIKKILCTVIALMLTASTIVIPTSVYAFEDFSDDFNSYTTDGAIDAMKANNWRFDSKTTSIEVTDGKIELPAAQMRKTLESDMESGYSQLKFSVTPSSTDGGRVFLFNTSHSDLAHNHNYGVVYFKSDGKVYGMAEGTSNIYSNGSRLLGSYTAGATYTINVIIDMHKRCYTVDIDSSLSSETLTSYTHYFIYGNEKIKEVCMNDSDDKGCYLDDFSYKQITAEQADEYTTEYIFTDEFSTYSTTSAFTSAGWTAPSTGNVVSWMIDGKFRLNDDGKPLKRALSSNDFEECAEITFQINPCTTTSSGVIVHFEISSTDSATSYPAAVRFINNKIYGQQDNNANPWQAERELGSYTDGATYDVTITLDKSGNYTVDVESSVATETIASYSRSIGEFPTYIRFVDSQANEKYAYIDNYTYREVDAPPMERITENFSDGVGQVTGGSSNIVDATYGMKINYKTKKLEFGDLASDGKYYVTFVLNPKSVATDDTNGQYVVRLGDYTNIVAIQNGGEVYGDACAADDDGLHTGFNDWRKISTSKIAMDTPIYVTAAIDYSAATEADTTTGAVGTLGTLDVTIKQGDTTMTNSCYIRKYQKSSSMTSAEAVENYKGLYFSESKGNADSDVGEVYIDDIVFGEAIVPTVDAGSITMTDLDGNNVENIISNVTTKLDKITVDFGSANLKSDTLNGIGVTVNGTEVLYKPVVDAEGGKVTLDILETVNTGVKDSSNNYIYSNYWLAPSATYTITVPAAATNVYNETLETSYTHTFTTRAAEYSAETTSLQINSADVTIDSITTGAVLTANIGYSSTYTEDKNAVAIIGIYDSRDALIGVDIADITLSATSVGTTMATFTVPTVSDVAQVKVFVWDSLSGITPLGYAFDPFAQN